MQCSNGHRVDRDTFQDWLSAANPEWHQYAQNLERTGTQPRTNPDGDVSVMWVFRIISNFPDAWVKVAIEHLGISYTNFVIPECPECMLDNHINSVVSPLNLDLPGSSFMSHTAIISFSINLESFFLESPYRE